MSNPAAGATYIQQLLASLSDRKAVADGIVEEIKAKAKRIGGVPFIPTGEEGKDINELMSIVADKYGPIANISFTTKDNAATGFSFESDDEEKESISFRERKSIIEDVNLTACPTNIGPVIPQYSQDEILKVVKEISEECEIRNQTSNLLDELSLDEVADAKCDIQIPRPETILEFPPEELPVLSPEEEPADALLKPQKTLIVLSGSTEVFKNKEKTVEVAFLKNVGDTITCGEPLLQIGDKILTSPVKNGVIRKYYNKVAKKGDKLVLIEEPSPDDTVNKVFTETEILKVKIEELGNLKEELGKLEPEVYVRKIISGIYVGQFLGYEKYSGVFAELAKKKDELFGTYNKNKELLNKYVVEGSIIINDSLSDDLKKKANDLIKTQVDLANKILDVNAQMKSLAEGKGGVYVKEEDPSALARVDVSNTKTKEGDAKKYVFINFETVDKESYKPIEEILSELRDIIRPYTNNILCGGDSMSKWDQKITNNKFSYTTQPIDRDINTNSQFSYSSLRINAAVPGTYIFNVDNGTEIWAGGLPDTENGVLLKALELSNSIQPEDNPDDVENSIKNLHAKDRNLPEDVRILSEEIYDKVVEYSRNLGYHALTKIYQDDIVNTLRKKYVNAYEILKTRYDILLAKIKELEAYIDDFPNRLENIVKNGCILSEGSQPSSTFIDGDKVTLIKWPVKGNPIEVDGSEPAEDINYVGNPRPNSPPVTSLKYWKKYCRNATTVNLLPLYWPIGIVIPTPSKLIKIPLPVIWKPIAVIPNPICLIVIGIAICGLCPAPFVYIVNPGWPFSIKMVGSKQSWHTTGIRGAFEIDGITTSEPLGTIPKITIPLKYTKDGVTQTKPVTVDAAPLITASLPFIQDDLPSYERLSLSNLAYVLYLGKWCAAGKKTMGFFENP